MGPRLWNLHRDPQEFERARYEFFKRLSEVASDVRRKYPAECDEERGFYSKWIYKDDVVLEDGELPTRNKLDENARFMLGVVPIFETTS